MSKRSDRREAERQARKLALQKLRAQPAQEATISSSVPEFEPIAVATAFAPPDVSKSLSSCPTAESETDLLIRAQAYLGAPAVAPIAPLLSDAQWKANRSNSLLSTGPVTTEGKQKSSRNSLKHALTGQTVLLPTDDAAEYQRRLDRRIAAFQPATEEESGLVQSLVDCAWRLDRIKDLETGILYKGQLEFADKYSDQPASRRLQLINTETYLKYEKSIRNLNIQEARLLRRMQKDQAQLISLQALRKRNEKLQTEARAKENRPMPASTTASSGKNGFDFSSGCRTVPTPSESGILNENLGPNVNTFAICQEPFL